MGGAHADLSAESPSSLQQALREAARMPPLLQRLGVRFKDPSHNGTYGVDNLVGYSMKSLSSTAGQKTEVSWASYVVAFHLHVTGKNCLEIIRNSKTMVLSAEVERCPRGGEPLTRGDMITVTPRSMRELAERKKKRLKVV